MATMIFLQELLAHSADGAYVVDQEQRIVAWNKAAEELLGFRAQDVVGAACFQVLAGHGDGGCTLCRRGCQPSMAAQRGESVSSFDIQVRTALGHPRWVNMSILPLPLDQEQPAPALVHLFRDVEARKQAETFANDVVARARQLALPRREAGSSCDDLSLDAPLTDRERQVLMLLARGADTDDIASQLVVHKATVRNHVQRILHKLGVHSRLEAVRYAQEHRLLE